MACAFLTVRESAAVQGRGRAGEGESRRSARRYVLVI
jgi:hypothetical protein